MRIVILVAVVALALVLLHGWWETETYRYKMTVTVETPRGPGTGSSVVEVRTRETSGINGALVTSRLTGEATVIALPNGELVFALLQGANGEQKGFALSGYKRMLPDEIDWRKRIRRLKTQSSPVRLAPEDYPVAVRFRDPTNPRTVERIGWGLTGQAQAPYWISSVVVQLTDEPPTSGIERHLPWLRTHRGSLDLGDGLHRDQVHPERNLTRAAFKQG